MTEPCGTCKWWQKLDPINDYDEPVMYEDRSPMYDDNYRPILAPGTWGWCKKVSEFGPRSGSDRFYVVDGSEYKASLSTRSDFGCIEHELKENA